MVFSNTRIFIFFIISNFMININHARSWDLAVTIGPEIDFFLNNGTLVRNITNRDVKAFTSITYDSSSHRIFLGDRNNKNGSIFISNLQSEENEMNELLSNTDGSRIVGMIYDRISESLFWIEDKRRAIFKIHINSNTSTAPEIILNLNNEIPRGLSIDLCNRRLYWANSNRTNSSIRSCNIDGTDPTVIIDENIYEPVAVAIDHMTAKLYWLDDEEGIHYKVERSNLDGTNREVLVRGRHQQPIHIAVDRDKVYWTDRASSVIWSVKKNKTASDTLIKWKDFDISNNDDDPTALIARDNVENVNCNVMKTAQINNHLNEKKNTTNNRYNTLAINNKEIDIPSKSLKLCLNDGFYNETIGACHCKQGFNGQQCELSSCHNYCLHGECKTTTNGKVQCDCAPEYSGPRCEKHICSDYCLNGGNCSVIQGEPFCACKFSQGNRCEDISDITNMCAMLCARQLHELNKTDINFCSCSKRISTYKCNAYHYDSWTKMLIVIFSIAIGVLTIIIIILSYFVNKFRRRPRIKKRFIVSKTGITPLTSRPQLPEDQCEIMIENCCNMNICETPCFEPKLRSSQSNTLKKDEKNSLLDHMVGNNSC